MEFKVGDKVRCIEGDLEVEEGEVYVVRDYQADRYNSTRPPGQQGAVLVNDRWRSVDRFERTEVVKVPARDLEVGEVFWVYSNEEDSPGRIVLQKNESTGQVLYDFEGKWRVVRGDIEVYTRRPAPRLMCEDLEPGTFFVYVVDTEPRLPHLRMLGGVVRLEDGARTTCGNYEVIVLECKGFK